RPVLCFLLQFIAAGPSDGERSGVALIRCCLARGSWPDSVSDRTVQLYWRQEVSPSLLHSSQDNVNSSDGGRLWGTNCMSEVYPTRQLSNSWRSCSPSMEPSNPRK